MSEFKGFGLLVMNTKGEWVINGEVIGANEELTFMAYDESKRGANDKVWYVEHPVKDVFVNDEGGVELVWFDGSEREGYFAVIAMYAFKARRSFMTMVA